MSRRNGRIARPNMRKRVYSTKRSLTGNCCGRPRRATRGFILCPMSKARREVCQAKSLKDCSRRKGVMFTKEGSFRVGRVKRQVRLRRVRHSVATLSKIRGDYYIFSVRGGHVVKFCLKRGTTSSIEGRVGRGLPICVIPAGLVRMSRVPLGGGNGASHGCFGGCKGG